MKKLILITLLLSMNFLYSQNSKTGVRIKEIKIETNNVGELKTINWKKVKKFFNQNKKNDSIKIVIILKADSKNNSNTDVQMKSIISEIKGQAFELNKMIRTAKKMTKEIVETEKELKTIVTKTNMQ